MRRLAAVFSVALVASLATSPRPAGAVPQTERAALPLPATAVDIAISDDDRYVGLAASTGQLMLLDTADFSGGVIELDACAGAATSLAFDRVGDQPRFYLGCDDGTVAEMVLDEDELPAVSATVYDLTVGTGSIEHVGTSPSEDILFTVEANGSEDINHAVTLEDGVRVSGQVSVGQELVGGALLRFSDPTDGTILAETLSRTSGTYELTVAGTWVRPELALDDDDSAE